MITVLGTLFKMLHFPGAAILLALGFSGITFIFFPLGLLNAWRNEEQRVMKPLYIATYITVLVVFISMLFKINHWPGAGLLLLIALPLPYILFLPVFIYSTSKVPNYSFHRIVVVMLLLTYMSVFNAFLALNVAKNRIDDSVIIASTYARAEEIKEIVLFESPNEASELYQASNELYSLLTIAEEEIITTAGGQPELLYSNPLYIGKLDSNAIPAEVLYSGDKPWLGNRLDNALERFLELADSYYANNITEDKARRMLICMPTDYDGQTWSQHLFSGTWTSWSLVYIEMLKSNLLLLRNELEIGIDL